jgi:hypothetical protein
LYAVGTFKLTVLDILYSLAFVVAIAEFLRVTHPGVDNSTEVNTMYIISVVYFGLFLVGLTGGGVFEIFNRTEFLVLLFFAVAQALIASKLNSRTATRGMSFENHA